MTDKYVITFVTERGEFRIWERYADRSKALAKELMAMGATGVEVWNADRETVVFQRGTVPQPA